MTESTGSGGGSEQGPGPNGDDPFAGLFREQPPVDPFADTNVVRPPLSWGNPPPQQSRQQPQIPQMPQLPPSPQTWSPTPEGQYPGERRSGSAWSPEETGTAPVGRPPFDDSEDEDWNPVRRQQPAQAEAQPPRNKKKTALVAGGSVGVLGILGLVGVLLTQNGGIASGLTGSHAAAPTPTPTVGFAATGTTPTEDITQTAQAFFTAWSTGNLQVASKYTDDPADALTAMQAYQTDLGASGLTITPQAVTLTQPTTAPSAGATGAGTTAPAPTSSSTAAAATSGTQAFSVTTTVAAPAAAAAASTGSATPSSAPSSTPSAGATAGGAAASASATWTYSSSVSAYLQGGRWFIKWSPGVLAPNLTSTEHLAAVQVPPSAGEITDADGNDLADNGDPGIRSIVSYLKDHVPAGSGTPGVAVELVDATGTAITGTADTIKPPVNAGAIATTIDPHIESLAETAVQQKSGSSMVVIRPSTGAILAVANNDDGRDDALGSREAPGSTMKIITATALFNYGVVTPSTGVACPPVETIQGVSYHNSGTDQEPDGTPFETDFAQSCNNAFSSEYTNLENLRLEGTAANTYGLNQPWNIGLGPSTYFTMPTDSGDESGSELAQEAFGQGKVSASPLSMASVAATVQSGSFNQPYLVSSVTDKVTATPLPSTTQSYLKQVMRAVITNPLGTAYGIPFGSSVYGKTGTAEHGPTNMSPNAWFTAVDPGQDVAACALVLDNTMNQDNYGATNAAPEVLHVFDGL